MRYACTQPPFAPAEGDERTPSFVLRVALDAFMRGNIVRARGGMRTRGRSLGPAQDEAVRVFSKAFGLLQWCACLRCWCPRRDWS
jgi:hypothetical protein